MVDLYSVDETNDDKEQFASPEGHDDLSENVSQALEDIREDCQANLEQEANQDAQSDDDTDPVQTVEQVLAASHEALKGVKPEDITKAISVLCGVDDVRKEQNGVRKEAVETLEALGYPRKALYALHARCKADPLVRAAIDPAYNYGCEVMDVKLQSEMWPKH